jgi:hypothetical protein
MTDKLAAFCCQKLGRTYQPDVREFEMGKPALCFGYPSVFLADDTGLWVGVGERLLHLDFELRTNLSLKLPVAAGTLIRTICQTKSDLWLGTAGDGLIQFNKASRKFRRFTEADGLLMDYVSDLDSAGNWLWILYSADGNGVLGAMDLTSLKPRSFMRSLDEGISAHRTAPPPGQPEKILASADGSAIFLSHFRGQYPVWRFWIENERYEELLSTPCKITSRIAADSHYLAAAGFGDAVNNSYTPRIVVAIQDLTTKNAYSLEDAGALPNEPSTVTLDGNHLWVGCEGAIAVIDLNERRARRYCHLPAVSVDRIQIAGGYLWALCEGLLYRSPLSAWQ